GDRGARVLARLRGLLVFNRRGVRYFRRQGHLLMKKSNLKQRSIQWFARQDIYGFIYRSWMKNRGVPQDMFDGRPVIGICNTWSELTPCNTHFRVLADHVRHGVLDAGGFPLEFPVMSLGETLMRPTAMLYRNLASMDVEESIRANPLDGVVLLAGCDKTTPATLMGACSVDLPTILVSGGPMLSGKYHGKDIGSGTNTWSMSEDLRAGRITLEEFHEAESCMHRSHGHCMTMGTASTMASMIEALGVGMPGNAAIPAVDARRYVLARMAGRRIVERVKEKISVSRILTREAFENAIRALAAIGGSTNAVIHLTALARRIGVDLSLDDFDRLIDDPKLDIDENCVMVLKDCAPKGYPGMAEVGNMPLPPKLLKKGVTDMVRISDARMSGTAYGTVVLHVFPEAAAGGALALVENGDMIELDVEKRRLVLLVAEDVLLKRRKSWKLPAAPLERGYWKLYFDHVLQASEGADLDFLVGKSGAFVPR